MKYAAIAPRFIDSELYVELVNGSPLTLIDGGSRGELFDPFDVVEAPLEVVAFEPDADAPRKIPKKNVNIHYINKALWKESGRIHVHLAVQPTTSSVYPPDLDLLGTFSDHIGAPPRTTKEIIEIESQSIDEAVSQGLCPPPNFIKLDIHSAEFEALEGATESLEKAFGVLVESWHSPIHRGQHLTGELEWFLNERGFYLFNLMHNSPWMHFVDGKDLELDRPRLVGSESLFFREDLLVESTTREMALHAIALADLFRYNRFAVLLSRRFLQSGILDPDLQRRIEEELNRIAEDRLRATRFSRLIKRTFRKAVRRLLA